MEGITSTTDWEECDPAKPQYQEFTKQMTKEAVAVCEGAIEAGASEILIKDAHGPGRNIDIAQLPGNVKIVRGWSGHPYMMVQGIDSSFDAAIFVGYHSAASKGGNPLSHTLTGRPLSVKINGEIASEFVIYSYAAALEGVPTVFLSGDKQICEDSTRLMPELITLPVKEGFGESTICLAPEKSIKMLRHLTKKTLSSGFSTNPIQLPENFEVEICFKEHTHAHKMSFFPGVNQKDSNTLTFTTDDYFEVLRMLMFVL
jgi:D-amino peptidase